MTGMILLGFSTFLTFLVFSLPLWGRVKASSWGHRVIESLTVLSALCIGSAFLFLVHAFLVSDLSFLNVALNSHSASDLLYKISGVWGNHEGSMLLWLVLLGLGASGVALQNGVQNEMRIGALQVLGAINFSFHLFVLLVSN